MTSSLQTLNVSLGERSYPIYIASGLLARADKYLSLARRVLIVTDDGVPPLYAQTVASLCKEAHLVTLPAGETSKTLSSFELLCREMLKNGFKRGDCVVAVGGGVVGDLAGFAAASYMRGIDFYNIPTTLLAQVDSSIGGKVAVNLDGIKNAVGAFYQPRAVLIDPDVLKTLSQRQLAAGLAESLKMATTCDKELFSLFEKGLALSRLTDVITASLRIKKAVVEEDEKESGLRRVLNFGHTVGHGIESLLGANESERERREGNGFYHGECIALGMLPMCSDALRQRLLPILASLGLPTQVSVNGERIANAMQHDKKAEKDGIAVILSDEVGTFRIEKYTVAELSARIKEVFA